MDKIYFSVVIPLYNKEKHIQRAVDSVLNQGYQNFELIIINDGSTDGSAKAIEKYVDHPDIRIIHQRNMGVCAARNTGIRSARFEYVTFLDADDAWKNNFLDEICSLINNYPNCGIYATAFQRILSGNKIHRHKYAGIPFANKKEHGVIKNLFYSMAYGHDPLSTSSSAIPKQVIETCGLFSEDIGQLQEDIDMWIRIALKYPIAFSGKTCVDYHCDAENRACLNLSLQQDYHPLEKRINNYIQQGLCSDENCHWLKEYLAIIYFTNTIRCLAHHKITLARKLSKKIITKNLILKIKGIIAYAISFLPLNMLDKVLYMLLPEHSKKMGINTKNVKENS